MTYILTCIDMATINKLFTVMYYHNFLFYFIHFTT